MIKVEDDKNEQVVLKKTNKQYPNDNDYKFWRKMMAMVMNDDSDDDDDDKKI